VAPKVASAPRGPGSGRLAGNLVQSLPQGPTKLKPSNSFFLPMSYVDASKLKGLFFLKKKGQHLLTFNCNSKKADFNLYALEKS
jgi:hypothetical protein